MYPPLAGGFFLVRQKNVSVNARMLCVRHQE